MIADAGCMGERPSTVKLEESQLCHHSPPTV